jgi:hypothetical protein
MNNEFAIFLPAAAVLLFGCTGSTHFTGSVDGSTDTSGVDTAVDTSVLECTTLFDCNPGVPCGSMIPCIDGLCRTDVTPIEIECPPWECFSDADCVIADPWDCCNGCPFVTTRGELAAHECFHERGVPPAGTPPVECMMDCYACPSCYPQPLSAGCVDGACVATVQGCPYPFAEDPPLVTPAEVAADPHGFVGASLTMRGSTIARWPVCDDFCPGDTPCCDAAMYLDAVVALAGWPCDTSMNCTSDTWCPQDWDCGAFFEGAFYEVMGEVSSVSGWEPPVFQVVGIREIEPFGVGGEYQLVIEDVLVWADDPGVDCDRILAPGDLARMVVADAGGSLVVTVPVFDGWGWCMEYWGELTGSSFEVWIPVDCDGCCCDFWITGSFESGSVTGIYHAYDGVCHAEVGFRGSR